MNDRSRQAILLLLFFLSGSSGLVYEVIWVRLVGLGFGNTVAAVSTVLAAFMAGLGLGAWFFGRHIERTGRGLGLYALIEVGIGLGSFALTLIFAGLDSYQVFLNSFLAENTWLIAPIKTVSVFLLVLPPTFLMGGTLPVIIAFAERSFGGFGCRLAAFYALNTLGATSACLAADFLLVPGVGLWQTGALAAAVNLLVALGAWGLRHGVPAVGRPELDPRPPGAGMMMQDAGSVSGGGSVFCLPAAVFCGFAGLGAEVVWTRLLLFFTGSRLQSFSLMLAVFLFFLGLGSLLAVYDRSRTEDRLKRKLAVAAWIWGTGIIFSMLPMVAVDRFLSSLVAPGARVDFSRLFAGTLICTATMALPCAALGYSFPVLGRLNLGRTRGAGTAVGGLYLANTCGSILGALAAGFLLLPGLGSQRALLILGGAGLFTGAVFYCSGSKTEAFRRRLVLPALAAAGMLGGWLLPGDWVIRKVIFLSRPAQNVLHVRESVNETLVVTEQKIFGRTISRTLWTNGFSMSATSVDGQRYMRLMAHLPLLLTDAPSRVLLICYGVGSTLAGICSHPQVESIDVVEISPQVLAADVFFRDFNGGSLDDPRVSTYIADGRNFLLGGANRYDVITLEPPPPTHAGVVNLYSREFYQLCRRRLREDGLFCQWLPANQMPYKECLSLIRSFCEVFPHSSLWFGAGADLLLVGGTSPLSLSLPALKARFAAAAVSADLEAVGVQNVYQLLALLNAGPERLRRLVEKVRPTTDDLPLIEYAGPVQGESLWETLTLCRMSGDPGRMIETRGWGADSVLSADSLYAAVEDAATLRRYAIDLEQSQQGEWHFASRIPLDVPLAERMPGNRYLEYLLGVDVSVVAAAFRVSGDINHAPSAALRIIGKHFFYRGDLDRAAGCFAELYSRQIRDPEVRSFLSYIRQVKAEPDR